MTEVAVDFLLMTELNITGEAEKEMNLQTKGMRTEMLIDKGKNTIFCTS
jgi:hypothetical protein